MDNLDKRKVEMTIECKCVGLDEALEKVTRLVELLKVIDEHKDLLDQKVEDREHRPHGMFGPND